MRSLNPQGESFFLLTVAEDQTFAPMLNACFTEAEAMPDNINSHLDEFPEKKNKQGQSQATEAKSVGSFWVRGKACAGTRPARSEIVIYLFSSPGRGEHAEVCI